MCPFVLFELMIGCELSVTDSADILNIILMRLATDGDNFSTIIAPYDATAI